MIEVIPGILETEWSEVERKVNLVAPYVHWVHVDIADGTLVPTHTFLDISRFTALTNFRGRGSLSTKAPASDGLSFEAHLMVANPGKYIRALVDTGFARLIAHIEADNPGQFLDEVRYDSVEVGLAIDGPTPFEQFEPFLEEIDVALVMTIEAGASGQTFQPEHIEKIKLMKRNLPDVTIAADGGINEASAKLVREAGATRIVSNSFIFRDDEKISQAIETLKNA